MHFKSKQIKWLYNKMISMMHYTLMPCLTFLELSVILSLVIKLLVIVVRALWSHHSTVLTDTCNRLLGMPWERDGQLQQQKVLRVLEGRDQGASKVTSSWSLSPDLSSPGSYGLPPGSVLIIFLIRTQGQSDWEGPPPRKPHFNLITSFKVISPNIASF